MNVPAFVQTCCLSVIYRLFQSHLESEVAALTFMPWFALCRSKMPLTMESPRPDPSIFRFRLALV